MGILVIGTNKAVKTPAQIKEVGIIPTGTLNITQNNTYNVTNYASAVVNVSGGGVSGPSIALRKGGTGNAYVYKGTTGIDIDGATGVGGSYTFYYEHYQNSALTGTAILNAENLTTVLAYQGFMYAFYQCTGITSTGLSSLTTISGDYAFRNAFYGCTNLLTTGLDSLVEFTMINTGHQIFQQAFYGCTSLTKTGLSGLRCVNSGSSGSPSSTNSLCNKMFYGCTSLTDIDMDKLCRINGNYCFAYMFSGCTGLTSVEFPSLARVEATGALQYMFQNCTNLTSISFPNLYYVNVNAQFSNLVNGITGCTIHFPSNLQATMSSWTFGGTNTVVSFDLPQTYAYIVDGIEHYRYAEYDTATSLAFINQSGTSIEYTNGTTLPSVGDRMYSDTECTILYGSISSIV